ncbi:uncharacterized protein LOC131658816 [Vicia villosa]|uniref:uncharacterized protein LOC131658816 n=1 Tax=Vicia villosa TaxID=3911 RepID=UPI00273C31F7|nr:uncharacterized protein LOC131658816 [Vicia villosa]
MVDVIKSKANIIVNKINQLSGSSSPDQKKGLLRCVSSYNSILIDVLLATQALQNENPKFAVENANYVGEDADGCENAFSGKSPLTAETKVMRDASAITSAICKLLL